MPWQVKDEGPMWAKNLNGKFSLHNPELEHWLTPPNLCYCNAIAAQDFFEFSC